MKIRIGIGLSAQRASEEDDFCAALLAMERCGFDSLWLSEVLTGPVIDPLVGLALAAGVTSKLKLGTTLAAPGRNPVRLAKELATIDRLSRGRLLLVMVPGLTDPREQQAIGIPMKERGAWLDEVLPLLRRLWSEDNVAHLGPRFSYEGLSLRPRPVQQPLEMWLGGSAPAALRRCGRLGEGWLPSLCTPAEALAGRQMIESVAAEHGRQIDPEHFGISLAYAHDAIPARQVASIAARRPGLDPASVVPVGLDALRQRLAEYIEVGFSKFVLRPAELTRPWPEELERLAAAVLPLQT